MIVVNGEYRSHLYVPIWNEITGGCQLINGIFQKTYGQWQEDTFGTGHPRPFAVIALKEKGQRNIEEGCAKLTTSVIVIALIALAYL
jgi:hypothetical protein